MDSGMFPKDAEPIEERDGWDGPYCHTKQHGSSDDPPDFLVSICCPAPTDKVRSRRDMR